MLYIEGRRAWGCCEGAVRREGQCKGQVGVVGKGQREAGHIHILPPQTVVASPSGKVPLLPSCPVPSLPPGPPGQPAAAALFLPAAALSFLHAISCCLNMPLPIACLKGTRPNVPEFPGRPHCPSLAHAQAGQAGRPSAGARAVRAREVKISSAEAARQRGMVAEAVAGGGTCCLFGSGKRACLMSVVPVPTHAHANSHHPPSHYPPNTHLSKAAEVL